MQLQNYVSGQWVAGSGKQAELIDAITGELIGSTSSGGSDPCSVHGAGGTLDKGDPHNPGSIRPSTH